MDVNSLIAFLISLAVGLALAFPLARALKRVPIAFYAVAFAIVGAYSWAVLTGVSLNNVRWLSFILQKAYLSCVLLAIVMFTGCFDEGTAIRKRLEPVRGELSILSFIFMLGHLVVFLPRYLGLLVGGAAVKGNVVASIVIALVLTALFIALGVTSFRFVKSRMSPRAWKSLQRFAYVIVGLLVVHVAFFMGTSALGGSGKGFVSLVAYIAVVALYAVLRLAKLVRDRRGRGTDELAEVGEAA